MPGTLPGPLGVAVFGGIKFLGYTLAATALKKQEPSVSSRAMVIAAVRTGLGFVLGPAATIASLFLLDSLSTNKNYSPYGNYEIYGLLVIARIFIWALLLYLFTRKTPLPSARFWGYALLGAIVSSLLDIPGYALAIAAPGKLVFC